MGYEICLEENREQSGITNQYPEVLTFQSPLATDPCGVAKKMGVCVRLSLPEK